MSLQAEQILRRAVIAARSAYRPPPVPVRQFEAILPKSRPAKIMAKATFDYILDAVCDDFLIPKEDILSTRGTPKIAFARQIAVFLCHKVGGWSQASTGRRFNRDPSTANHACTKIERMIAADPEFAARVQAIRNTITGSQS